MWGYLCLTIFFIQNKYQRTGAKMNFKTNIDGSWQTYSNQHAWSSNILAHIHKLFTMLAYRDKVYNNTNKVYKWSVNPLPVTSLYNKTDVLKLTK